jgi:hypothetical protein
VFGDVPMAFEYAAQANVFQVPGVFVGQVSGVKKLPIGIIVVCDEQDWRAIHHLHGREYSGVHCVVKRPFTRREIVMIVHE